MKEMADPSTFGIHPPFRFCDALSQLYSVLTNLFAWLYALPAREDIHCNVVSRSRHGAIHPLWLDGVILSLLQVDIPKDQFKVLAFAFEVIHGEDPYRKLEYVEFSDAGTRVPQCCRRARIHRQRSHLCYGIPTRGADT